MKAKLFLISILLVGCMTANQATENRNFTDPLHGYAVNIPSHLKNWTTFSKTLSGPSYPFFTPSKNGIEDENILIRFDLVACPSLGITEPQKIEIANSIAVWGEVDAWKAMNAADGFEMTEELLSSPCRNFENKPMYGFCAEKDGKAVAICIQQMTDNEEQAKQIFESFRWTD